MKARSEEDKSTLFQAELLHETSSRIAVWLKFELLFLFTRLQFSYMFNLLVCYNNTTPKRNLSDIPGGSLKPALRETEIISLQSDGYFPSLY